MKESGQKGFTGQKSVKIKANERMSITERESNVTLSHRGKGDSPLPLRNECYILIFFQNRLLFHSWT